MLRILFFIILFVLVLLSIFFSRLSLISVDESFEYKSGTFIVDKKSLSMFETPKTICIKKHFSYEENCKKMVYKYLHENNDIKQVLPFMKSLHEYIEKSYVNIEKSNTYYEAQSSNIKLLSEEIKGGMFLASLDNKYVKNIESLYDGSLDHNYIKKPFIDTKNVKYSQGAIIISEVEINTCLFIQQKGGDLIYNEKESYKSEYGCYIKDYSAHFFYNIN